MAPAQRGDDEFFSQLGYLLSGDHDRAARLVRAARSSPGGSPVAALVQEFLADPGEGHGRDDVPELAGLPPRRRAAVVLRYWAGLSAAEVAWTLRCTEAEVDEPGDWSPAALRTVAAEAVGGRRRRRLRAVAVAVGVLVAAGVFATMLSAGSTESAPEAAVSRPPWTAPADGRLTTLAPGSGAVVIDARARKLTEQLTTVVDREFPELTKVRAGPSGPMTGYTVRPPLEFYTRAETYPPDTYFAQAIVDAHGKGVLVLLELRRQVVEEQGWQPCRPEFEQDCVYREFPDRTRAVVEGYLDPGSRDVVRRLTSLRPDGTLARVTAYGSPISVAELFRFALVFTW
ncbi:RNA polymerase sigma factor [Actinophytocola sediminis]